METVVDRTEHSSNDAKPQHSNKNTPAISWNSPNSAPNSFLGRIFLRPAVYVGIMLFITAILTYLCAGIIVFEPGNRLYPTLWVAGFGFLIFNVVYCLVCSLYALFIRPELFPEAPLAGIPKTAILYPVLSETVGLYERMAYTLANNDAAGVDLWVLSDSPMDMEVLSYESQVVQKLRDRFGQDRIHYWRRKQPTERKQGNIQGWLDHHRHEYPFFIVCDADTILPEGAVARLLRKAAHPANQDIAIFQTKIHITHARTYFAKFQASSTPLVQRLYVTVNQRVFGRSMYFGHAALVRSSDFAEIRLPKGIYSHDIWESALLDQIGKSVVFCSDVISYEEVPGHYLEMRAREKRWAKGNLQTFPLLWAPGLSLHTRFHVFYGLYMYIAQPVFLIWIILGFFGGSILEGKLLSFQRYTFLGASVVDLEMTSMLIGVLLVVFLHKMVVARSWRDVRDIVYEILLSTFLCLNNVLYQTIDLLSLPFGKRGWRPMTKDPEARLSFKETAANLWPSTALGLLGLYWGWAYAPHWFYAAFLFLLSFTLSIPIA